MTTSEKSLQVRLESGYLSPDEQDEVNSGTGRWDLQKAHTLAYVAMRGDVGFRRGLGDSEVIIGHLADEGYADPTLLAVSQTETTTDEDLRCAREEQQSRLRTRLRDNSEIVSERVGGLLQLAERLYDHNPRRFAGRAVSSLRFATIADDLGRRSALVTRSEGALRACDELLGGLDTGEWPMASEQPEWMRRFYAGIHRSDIRGVLRAVQHAMDRSDTHRDTPREAARDFLILARVVQGMVAVQLSADRSHVQSLLDEHRPR